MEKSPGPHTLLVTISAIGHKPSVFFFPGMGMPVSSFGELSANLGDGHPLYALNEADFIDLTGRIKTIEQIAGQYAEAIRASKYIAPPILAGYSFGGHMALETARLLAAAGEAEPLVILIDTYPAPPYRTMSLIKRMQFYFAGLRKLSSFKKLAGYFTWKKFSRNYSSSLHAIQKRLGRRGVSPYSAAYKSFNRYQPVPYPGRVVLFKASQREWDEEYFIMDAWEKIITGRVDVRTVPGKHLDLMNNPTAIDLAKQMKEVMG